MQKENPNLREPPFASSGNASAQAPQQTATAAEIDRRSAERGLSQISNDSKPQAVVAASYRPDIDGLRAVAVMAVVAFHAFPQRVKGGFIGVDVFFVISGFLISGIIFSGLKQDTHSLANFYIRRIRRIFPALLIVLGASITAGWFELFPDEYKQLGKHVAGGAGFVSNFLSWGESGYFDSVPEAKPLLHLWSLGIEEQFYIFWPFFLALAWKSRGFTFAAIIFAAASSFACSVLLYRTDAVADFYSPQTRFWELAAGSILAYLALGRPIFTASAWNASQGPLPFDRENPTAAGRSIVRGVQSILGALLIAAGFIFIKKTWHFPGPWAALPVAGTVLIIAAGRDAWLNRVILSNRALVGLGLVSYPLYLWHWPLLSFAQIVQGDASTPLVRFGLVVVSVALAWLTYSLVEKPIRFGTGGRGKTLGLCVAMAGLGLSGFFIFRWEGIGYRFAERTDFLSYFENSRPEWRYFEKIRMSTLWRAECAFFDAEKYRLGQLADVRDTVPRPSLDKTCFERDPKYPHAVMIWGDSHAQQLAPGLARALPKSWQPLQVASSGCPPAVDATVPSPTSQCDQSNYFALRTIEQATPDVVVIAQSEGQTAVGFAEIATKLQALGVKKTILVGPAPRWNTELPKLLVRQLWNGPRRSFRGIDREVLKKNSELKRSFKTSGRVVYADLIAQLCNADGCITYFGDDKKLGITSWDGSHLTPAASEYLAKTLLVGMITSTP